VAVKILIAKIPPRR